LIVTFTYQVNFVRCFIAEGIPIYDKKGRKDQH